MKTPLPRSISTLLLATLCSTSAFAADPPPARPAEMLEKGIYAEETKGDLDAAINIYQQLIADTKTAQKLAAQAQFRLAQCYLKKNRLGEATAALEKLIRDFPDEKELVAKAREILPSEIALGPIPWADGERMQLTLSLASGMEIGLAVYRADLTEVDGRKVWRVGGRMSAGAQSVSSVDADAETFRPLTSYWRHQLLGEASGVYRESEVEIQKSGSPQPTVIPIEKAVYDNEQVMLLMRRLPFTVGYKTTVPVVAVLGAKAVLPIELEVVAKETVEAPAGKFDCFKVQMNVGQTFWLSDDAHRYVVKFEAGGATALLTRVSQQKPGVPVQFNDEARGISLTAPAGWAVHVQNTGNKPGRQTVRFMDPDADADDVTLRSHATDSLPAASRASAQVWAESDFRDGVAKAVKDARIRPESWKAATIGGRAGISFVADYMDKDRPMIFCGIYSMGPKSSDHVGLMCAADKFEALKPALDMIAASYRSK